MATEVSDFDSSYTKKTVCNSGQNFAVLCIPQARQQDQVQRLTKGTVTAVGVLKLTKLLSPCAGRQNARCYKIYNCKFNLS